MQFNFQQIISALNDGLPPSDNFAFRIARTAVVPADYLFNTILPQENRPDYHVNGGTMTIYPTMLGQVPMDHPYPPMGAISATQFFEQTTKLGGQMFFPEKDIRELQAWEKSIIANGFLDGQSAGQIAEDVNARRMAAVLGFANLITKAHWDTYEWLRGQALSNSTGIDWTFSDIPLKVTYNIPSTNVFTPRTGNDAYQGSTSKFWADIRKIYKYLTNFRIIMNSNTWYSIIDNSVNNIQVVVNFGDNREIIKVVGTTEQRSTDQRDRVRITIYDKSGTIIDAKTGALTPVPFLADGKIIVVGEMNFDGVDLTTGSVADPDNTLRLGYTHIAPTVEGQGRPGIWARIFTPEQKPMQVQAETAANMLPVILNPKKLIIMETEVT